jgi:hypothetical protein
VRAPVTERNAEPLGIADDDVRAPLARRRQENETEKIGRHRDQRIRGVNALARLRVVEHCSVGGRILDQRAENVGSDLEVGIAADTDGDSPHTGPGLYHFDRLRMTLGGDEENLLSGPAFDCVAHRHRLGRRRRFVEQRRVGDLDTRQVYDRRLEI